jgi:peptidoglycan hydrolase-like protein with peptidoglycan-binding domain
MFKKIMVVLLAVVIVAGFAAESASAASGYGGDRRSGRRSTSSGGQVLGASTSCGVYLDGFLRKGYTNDSEQVSKLQSFLADHLKTALPATGVFGTETEAAVKKFQEMHSDEILTPWGIGAPTGIVFRTTSRVINNYMCPDLSIPLPAKLVPWSADPETAKN